LKQRSPPLHPSVQMNPELPSSCHGPATSDNLRVRSSYALYSRVTLSANTAQGVVDA